MALNGVTLSAMVGVSLLSMSEEPSHYGITTPADTIEPADDPSFNRPIIDNRGYLSGSAAFAFHLACQNTTDRFQQACHNALMAYDLTGIDPIVMIYKEALETNFGHVASPEGQDAIGSFQIQAGELITGLHEIARDMTFYNRLDADEPTRVAIDRLLSDRSTLTDRERAAQLRSGEGDDLLSSEQYQLISELRRNDDFAAEFAGLRTISILPEAHSDNFNGTDLAARGDVATKAYLVWNQGQRGGAIIYDAIQSSPESRVAEIETISTANINSNSGRIFQRGINTILECVPHDIQQEIMASMGGFARTLDTAISVAATHDADLIAATWNDVRAVTTSPRPQMRPDNLVIDIPQQEIEIEYSWHDIHCGEQTITQRPIMRPDNNPHAIEERESNRAVLTSKRPIMRPGNAT